VSLKQTHWNFDIETSSKICLLSKTLLCHCSRLTSCTWMNRRVDSLMSRAMRVDESLHWQWVLLKQTHCWGLLIEIETSRSSRLISLIALWDRDFTQFYDWPRLSAHQTRKISCEFEWAMYSLIFDLVEWFQSFVYTRWSAHEWRKVSAAARTQVARSKSIESWRTTSRSTRRNRCRLFHFACNEEAFI